MTRFLQVLNAVLLIVVIGFVLLAAWWLWGVHLTVETTLRDFHTTVIEAGLTLKNLREASQTWKDSSQKQASATTSAMQSVTAVAAQLSTSISRVETSSTALLGAAETAVNEQSTTLTQSQLDLQKNLEAMLAATQTLQKTISDADAQITDPAIKQSLQNLAEGTKQLADSSTQMTAIATDGRQVADKFRNDYLKPQKFAWELLKQLAGLGGSFAQMIK